MFQVGLATGQYERNYTTLFLLEYSGTL